MRYQLIMLPQPILVSDEIAGYTYNKPTWNADGRIGLPENNQSRKIIAGIPELPSIVNALSEEDCKKIGWYSLERAIAFATSKFDNLYDKHPSGGKISVENIMDVLKVGVECGYKFGTKQSLNEKKFSEEDIRKAWNTAYVDALSIDEETYKPLFFEDFIQSLSQPKVFDVAVEKEAILEHTENCLYSDEKEYLGMRPKITNNSIKVIKVL